MLEASRAALDHARKRNEPGDEQLIVDLEDHCVQLERRLGVEDSIADDHE